MKCQRQPRFLDGRGIQITHVLEVRLAPMHWNRIKIVCWQRKKSYSTISRYCVLKLARKCGLRWTPKLQSAWAGAKKGMDNALDVHRHLMCLYGEDEKLIRLAAMELGLTISGFVRLAIEMYLPTLAMANHSRSRVTDADLRAEGIRFSEEVQIFATNAGPGPCERTLVFFRFDLDSYW